MPDRGGIFIVDDNPSSADMLRELLENDGYAVDRAARGEDALAAIPDAEPNLMLLGDHLPDINPFTLLEKLKQSDQTLYIPVIFMIALDDAEARVKGVELGDDLITKPFEVREVLARVERQVTVSKVRMALRESETKFRSVMESASSHNAKDFLARNQIPYQWLDIEKDAQARALVETIHQDRYRLPVVFFPDGSLLVDSDLRTLAQKVGLHTQAQQPFYNLIIIGAGPAGLAAAVYGASEGLRTVVIEKEATGGQAGTSARIENYLGFPHGLSGVDLARRATAQATRFGAEILTAQEATQVRIEDPYRFVTLGDGTELSCHALLIATGMTVHKPNIPGIDSLIGTSVYYGAAFTEAKHYQGGHVFVLGGANSAGQGAVFLSQYANRVTILIRGDSLEKNMSQYLVDQINQTQNIEVLLQTEVAALLGTDRLEAITIQNRKTGKTEKLPADAMFIFIGASPHTEIVTDVVERDEAGFIFTGPDLIHDGRRPKNWKLKRDPFLVETGVPGVFAAGDVRHGVVRRVASAVGQGAVAISFVHKYLETV